MQDLVKEEIESINNMQDLVKEEIDSINNKIRETKGEIKLLTKTLNKEKNYLNKIKSFFKNFNSFDKKVFFFNCVELCSSKYWEDFEALHKEYYIPDLEDQITSFFDNKSHKVVNGKFEPFFFSNEPIPGALYKKEVASIYETFTKSDKEVFYNSSPLLLNYNGIFLAEYACVKGLDNNKYNVYLFEDNILKLQPILQGYGLATSFEGKITIDLNKSIDDFIKSIISDENSREKESKKLLSFIKNNSNSVMTNGLKNMFFIYKFNEEMYNNIKNNSILRKKIKQEMINLMDRKDLSVFFLESHKLPVNNIFS